MLKRIYHLSVRVRAKLRALWVNRLNGTGFTSVGRLCKVLGGGIRTGDSVNIGDFCWIEAVNRYPAFSGVQQFSPVISFGRNISLSDSVHISAVQRIEIGNDTLIGSKVYIGDHSHGSYADAAACAAEAQYAPIARPLADIAAIHIGERCWIGDGAVILAGAQIGDNSVVGANSVVKGVFPANVVIAGSPAKVIKSLK